MGRLGEDHWKELRLVMSLTSSIQTLFISRCRDVFDVFHPDPLISRCQGLRFLVQSTWAALPLL